MTISHLSFSQLNRLGSSLRLMTVTMAYHRALRRRLTPLYQNAFFPTDWIAEARQRFPECAARYERVLSFLRSKELRKAIRRAADRYVLQPNPDACILLCSLTKRRTSAHARGVLITAFCRSRGADAFLVSHEGEYKVYVNTTAEGVDALRYHTGSSIHAMRQACRVLGLDYSQIFWWVPAQAPGWWKLNPIVEPRATPDVNEYADWLIWQEDAPAAS